jgi:ABC-type phosphate transport system permease subunit
MNLNRSAGRDSARIALAAGAIHLVVITVTIVILSAAKDLRLLPQILRDPSLRSG